MVQSTITSPFIHLFLIDIVYNTMATSGTVSVGKITYVSDSLTLDQIEDVTAVTNVHNNVIIYKDNLVDPLFTTGWHSNPLGIEDLTNVEVGTTNAVQHNEVVAYNDGTDAAVEIGWVNRPITSLFTGLEATIEGIVASANAVIKGEEGDAGKTDMVMMTADVAAGDGTTNVSIGSSTDNNKICKRELTDTDYVFIQSLDKGEIANLTYTVGTLIQSSKGIYGFTGPFPMPLGMPSFSLKLSRFSVSSLTSTIICASSGTEVTVTLLASDGSTIVDGPTVLAANNVASFACGAVGEYIISSTGYIICTVNENGTRLRVLPPMSAEVIGWNNNASISALSGTASVDWYRQTGATGTQAVVAGTALAFSAAGNDADHAETGCIILRSDVPISSFANNDSSGLQAIPHWPLDQLSQSFPNPGYIDSNADYGQAGISIGSPYEGTATVYDATDTLVATFTYTRATTVVTAADQLCPAAGRWKPSDITISTVLDGGYILTNTPAICIINYSGSVLWTADAGDEIIIAGTTPDDLRAEIRKDALGILRRRDVDAAGAVTWNVC